MMRRVACWLAVAALAVDLTGCGGGHEKGKHQDFDRPGSADTRR